MNALERRLRALESIAARRPVEDSEEAREINARVGELFAIHDESGELRAAFDAARGAQARSQVISELARRMSDAEIDELLALIAAADGRQRALLNEDSTR